VRAKLVVAVVAVLAVAAPAATARPRLEIGVQDDAVFMRQPLHYGGYAKHLVSREKGYAAARKLAVRAVRINVIWKWVAPSADPATWDWSYYDAAVDAALAHGVQPQLTLTGPAPAWATGDRQPGVVRPDPKAFGSFVSAAATRYAGRVQRYSIWNEPNWPSWLQPHKHAASLYRRLYQVAYRALRAADPAAKVLIGELAPMGRPEAATPPLRFLRSLVCRDRRLHARHHCAPLVADGFAIHPYALRWSPDYRGPGRDDVTIGSLPRLTGILRGLARRHALSTPSGGAPSLYLTEFAYHANSPRIPEAERVGFTLRSFAIAAQNRHVRQIVWYQLAAPPFSPVRQWDTALLKHGGKPRPTFVALAQWLRVAVRSGAVAAARQRVR
jgi:hypothetical protein